MGPAWKRTSSILSRRRLKYDRITSIALINLKMLGKKGLVAQRVKSLPAMWETQVWSLDWQDPLEKEMANHSSILAWRIPWMEEPGRLQSMGLRTVRHNWATSLSLFTFIHWRRKWQSTAVFLPGKSHGQRSLVGYSPWGHKSRT